MNTASGISSEQTPAASWNRPARPTEHNTWPSVPAPLIRTEEPWQSSAVCGFCSIVGGPRNMCGQHRRSQWINLGCESQERLREMPLLLPGCASDSAVKSLNDSCFIRCLLSLQEKMEWSLKGKKPSWCPHSRNLASLWMLCNILYSCLFSDPEPYTKTEAM